MNFIIDIINKLIIHVGFLLVYTKNMMQIFEILVGPMMSMMESRLRQNELALERMRREKEQLHAKLKRMALQRPYSETII